MRALKLIAVASAVLLGTTVFAQNITYDYDKAADFSTFKTYAWVRGTDVADKLNHTRVVNAIDAQLASKGLRKVAAGKTPDVLVAYHAAFDKQLRINGFSSGWGGYRFAGSRSGSATTEDITIGTLAVDVVDAATNTIVWRGIASKEIDVKASPDKRDKNINKAAEKMFRNYPPHK